VGVGEEAGEAGGKRSLKKVEEGAAAVVAEVEEEGELRWDLLQGVKPSQNEGLCQLVHALYQRSVC
jgi:hypothetical protein